MAFRRRGYRVRSYRGRGRRRGFSRRRVVSRRRSSPRQRIGFRY